MKKNNSGFTLVELLVTIIILGIITTMSFPLLRRLQESNKMNRIELYGTSLEELAKAYVEAYEDDLFPIGEINKCAVISVDMLESKKVYKDISIDDFSCKSDNTFILVSYKDEEEISGTYGINGVSGKSGPDARNRIYKYTTYLGCGSKVNDVTGKVDSSNVTIILPQTDPERNEPYTYSEVCPTS